MAGPNEQPEQPLTPNNNSITRQARGFTLSDDSLAFRASRAREKLRPWAEGRMHMQNLGLEGISALLRLAWLDKDGDGQVSKEEFAQYEVQGEKLVNDAISLNTNIGIVAALMLTMHLPMKMAAPSDDASACFGDTGVRALQYVTFVCDALVVTFCVNIIFNSSFNVRPSYAHHARST